MDLLSTSNILVHIPVGSGGYDLSYIEAIGTICGLLCIYLASIEKTINYLFGLLNVSLFAIIFFQINLYASLMLQVFFFIANIYGWYAWTRVKEGTQEVELKTRWMSAPKLITTIIICAVFIGLLTVYIDPVFKVLTDIVVNGLNAVGFNITMPELEPDAYPFWDSTMMVLSIVAQILMTRKYVENWIIWVIINLISIVIFSLQGVYAMAIEYAILTFIALNGVKMWQKSAKENGSKPLSSINS
ncbi:nicotinamide riboside transporter PnuC [Zophobihabitans entericus]|uniref:nicotinamide riboside transporter PnuC n=1 Tax=Zophobihabitans entericus TaxID=1635327 RepID=UPI00389A1E3F